MYGRAGYVHLTARELVDYSTKTLAAIERYRENAAQSYAEEEAKRRNKRWWRILFRLRPLTSDDIIKETCRSLKEVAEQYLAVGKTDSGAEIPIGHYVELINWSK